MTKSKVFESLKILAYLIGFPLMSLIMLITFIPMLNAEFMGDFAVIWIVVTLAIWAFVAIIQYIFHVTLSKKGGMKKDIANLAVMVIAILSILLPGAIFGAVQAKNYNAVVAEALKSGIELDNRKALMGWFKSYTDKDENAIIDLQKDINAFISDYNLKNFETELFGSAADNAAGIGYYPGVSDKIRDELKRKEQAYLKLQQELAKRKAVEDANEEVLKPLRDAYEEALNQSKEELPLLQAAIDAYYGPLNTAYASMITPAATQIYQKLANNYIGLVKAINDAIASATTILGDSPQASEDTAISAQINEIADDLLPKMQAILQATEAALAESENVGLVEAVDEAGAALWDDKDPVMENIDAIISALSITVTAENAQTIFNQATSAKTAYDALMDDFNQYRSAETGSITYYNTVISAGLAEKNSAVSAINRALAETKKLYDEKVAEQVPDYYPFDGYPTSIKLVFTETVYTAQVQNIVEDTSMVIYTPDFTEQIKIYKLDENKPSSTVQSSSPFSYATYVKTTVSGFNALTMQTEDVETYVMSGTANATEKEIKTIPLIETLLNAFGINYSEFTNGISSVDELYAADLTFTRPENVDQIIEWLLPMLAEQLLGADAAVLLGRDVTFNDVNAVLAKAFDMLYPMGEDGFRHVNAALDAAISGLLGENSSGLLGMLMPFWDLHNKFTVVEEGGEIDYFSGLLLTAAQMLDARLGLGDMLYGILPQTIDIVLGNGPIARAQAEYDKGYSEAQLKELQYKLNNYPEIIAFANFWHVCVIFSGVVLFSMILSMYFAKKQKEYMLSDSNKEEA